MPGLAFHKGLINTARLALNKASRQACQLPSPSFGILFPRRFLGNFLVIRFSVVMYFSLLAIAVGVCFPFTATAAPTASQVYTPFGLRPADSVHQIPDGASIHHVGSDIHILDAKGTLVQKTTPSGNFTRKPHAANTPALQDGWVAYAYWMNTGKYPINYFDTLWTVPPAPPKSDGQTIFLFNSIEPSSGDAILQPVLQWGVSAAGGGPYWSIANWWGINGVFHFTPLVKVQPGRVLQGIMILTGTAGSTYNYVSYFNGIGAKLIVNGVPEQLKWATETLEVYSLQSKSDLPTGQTLFSNIHLRTTAGYPPVTWSTVSSSADGASTFVNRQGANGAAIRIVY
ncbi:hypothetical protein DL93DRAFT_2084260 [Clavulina sp. PMI_390]|nr:hypothetical protein DL93DRAFT_2084260 [Clavulina sp. PMI_390]